MTPPKLEAGFVRMPEDEFEAMLARAAGHGANRALANVGLDGPEAAIDIHDLRTLLESLRMARRTAWQTIVRLMTTDYFADWRNVPKTLWRWANFSPEEIACRGDGTIRIDEAALNRLQTLREKLGAPMIVNSAYRSPEYNRKVGGAKHSMHLQGAAFGISMTNHDPESFEAAARAAGFTGFGYYHRQNFIHVDTGCTRQWGDPFPPRLSRFAEEPPRLRKSLNESRTMKGGGAAGVATIGAAGVEVAKQAVADTQSALQPLIPCLDTLRWLLIAAALVGVGITIYARWDDWRKGRR